MLIKKKKEKKKKQRCFLDRKQYQGHRALPSNQLDQDEDQRNKEQDVIITLHVITLNL